MKISIITATYNSEASIGETVQSLALQTIPRGNMEWIVVDGASSDRTIEIIKEGDFQPDKLVSERDTGIYDALNKGVHMATGDVIGFLHADDFLASPNALNRISCAFHNTGAEALYGDLQYVRPLENGGFGVVRHWVSGVYYPHKLQWGWMLPHPTLYLKREIFERVKLGNGEYFNTAFRCAADYDFMMRILGKYEIEPTYLRMVLVKMRVGGVSNRSIRDIIQKSKEDWVVIRENKIGHIHTLVWKNLSKLRQFFTR